MKDFQLEATQTTPKVQLLATEGKIDFEGACYPEDASGFFRPINEWIDEFRRDNHKLLMIDIRLDYFNTSSSKCLMDVFITFEEMKKEGMDVRIKWHYCQDDEDMQESGEEFAEDLDVPFELIAY